MTGKGRVEKRRTKTSPGPAPRPKKGRAAKPPKAAVAPEPPRITSDGERTLVQLGVAAGVSLDYLRRQVQGGTLNRAQFEEMFAAELEHGKAGANLKVATNLFRIATAWPPIKGATTTAAIFWMKKRGDGWDDEGGTAKVKVATSGAAGDGSVSPEQIVEVSFKIGDDSKIKEEG